MPLTFSRRRSDSQLTAACEVQPPPPRRNYDIRPTTRGRAQSTIMHLLNAATSSWYFAAVFSAWLLTVSVSNGLRIFTTYLDSSPYVGFKVTDLDTANVDTILYGNVGVNLTTGSIVLGDTYSTEQLIVDPEDNFCNCCRLGNVGALWSLKKKYPWLKTILVVSAINVWQLGTNYSSIAFSQWTNSAANRTSLAAQLVSYVYSAGFDGIHISWPNLYAQQVSQLTAWLIELKSQLTSQSNPVSSRAYQLSFQVPANASVLNSFNWSSVEGAVDRIHLNGYQTQGSDGLFRHAMSPYLNSSDPDQFRSVNSLQGLVSYMSNNASIPLSKVVMTLGFQGLAYYSVNGLYQAYGSGPNVAAYSDWIANLTASGSGWALNVDSSAGNATWFFHNALKNAVSLPTVQSMTSAMTYLNQSGILGVEAYDVTGDLPRQSSLNLWNTIAPFATIDNSTTVPNPTTLCISSSSYCNFRCNSYCYQYRVKHYCAPSLNLPNSTAGTIPPLSIALTYYTGGSNGFAAPLIRDSLLSAIPNNSATFFVSVTSVVGLNYLDTMIAARRAMYRGHSIGLLLDSNVQTYLQMTTQQFTTFVQSQLSTLGTVLGGNTSSLVRFNYDGNDPSMDRLCQVLGGNLGLDVISWNIDPMDYAQANVSGLVTSYNTSISTALQQNTTRSFVSLQMDGNPLTLQSWQGVQNLLSSYSMQSVNMSTCLAKSVYIPAPNQQNAGSSQCALESVVTQCVDNQAWMIALVGDLASDSLYNLTENIRVRSFLLGRSSPILPLSVFATGDSFVSASATARSKAAYMAYKLRKEGHDLGVAVYSGGSLTASNLYGIAATTATALQNAGGVRPHVVRLMLGSSSTFDMSLCGAVTGNGLSLVQGNLQSAWLDMQNHPSEMSLLAQYSTNASFISTQEIAYLGNSPISPIPADGDIVAQWLAIASQKQLHPVGLGQCLKQTVYDAPIYRCGDGVCFTPAETCSSCPGDCPSCTVDPPFNPFVAAAINITQPTGTPGPVVVNADAFLAFIQGTGGIVTVVVLAMILVGCVAHSLRRSKHMLKKPAKDVVQSEMHLSSSPNFQAKGRFESSHNLLGSSNPTSPTRIAKLNTTKEALGSSPDLLSSAPMSPVQNSIGSSAFFPRDQTTGSPRAPPVANATDDWHTPRHNQTPSPVRYSPANPSPEALSRRPILQNAQ